MACEGMAPCGAQAPTGRALGGLQSCGSTTAISRTPALLQLRRAPLEFCWDALLRRLGKGVESTWNHLRSAAQSERFWPSHPGTCKNSYLRVEKLSDLRRPQLFTQA